MALTIYAVVATVVAVVAIIKAVNGKLLQEQWWFIVQRISEYPLTKNLPTAPKKPPARQ